MTSAVNIGDVEAEAIRTQVERIVNAKAFDASDRNRRFLRYIVEEKLAGRGDRIKAYNIATEVFQRKASFDPQIDPIVRIEASRLRRALDRYYLAAGQADPIRIAIPTGSYVPTVELVKSEAVSEAASASDEDASGALDKAEPSVPSTARRRIAAAIVVAAASCVALVMLWAAGYLPSSGSDKSTKSRNGPAILVAPFENDGGPIQDNLVRGFTREVITGLTRFNDVFVFGPETSFRYAAGADWPKVASELGVDFVLTGGISVTADTFRVTASLANSTTGQYVWSGRFNAELGAAEIQAVRDGIADQVVRELAQPYGVIFNKKVKEIEGKPAHSITSYECVLRFYQYWRSYDVALYAPVRACLEQALLDDPGYADAYASLSIVYLDSYRFKFDKDALAFDPLVRAYELAQRAVELAPDSAFAYHALHLVHWLRNEVDLSFAAGERGLQLNPNDTSLMADLGQRYTVRGQWDKGLPLLEEAFVRNPAQPGQYRIGFFLKYYIAGDYEQALLQAKQIDAPNVIITHVILAAVYGQLGRTDEAKAAVARILEIDPAYGEKAAADLAMRSLHPDYIPLMLDGLRKAGLPVATKQDGS
jgi:adenylate cyclase